MGPGPADADADADGRSTGEDGRWGSEERGREVEVARGCGRPARHSLHRPRENDRRRGQRRQRRRRAATAAAANTTFLAGGTGRRSGARARSTAREGEGARGGREGEPADSAPRARAAAERPSRPHLNIFCRLCRSPRTSWSTIQSHCVIFEWEDRGRKFIFLFARPPAHTRKRVALLNLTAVR